MRLDYHTDYQTRYIMKSITIFPISLINIILAEFALSDKHKFTERYEKSLLAFSQKRF